MFTNRKGVLSIILIISLLVGSIQLGFATKAEAETSASDGMKLLKSTGEEVPWPAYSSDDAAQVRQSTLELETPVSLTKLRLKITKLSSWNNYKLREVRIYDVNGNEIQRNSTPTVNGSMTSQSDIHNLIDGSTGHDFVRKNSSTRTPTDEYLEFTFKEVVTVSKVTLETAYCYDGNQGGDGPFGWQIWGNIVYTDDNGTIQYAEEATVTCNDAMKVDHLRRVNDGDYTSAYVSSDNPDMSNQYIQYTWMAPVDINLVTLYSQHCGTASNKGQAPTEWTIQVSKDGDTFTEVCKVSKEWNGNEKLQSKNSQFDLQEDILAMRVVITKANLDWGHYAVYEIEVGQTLEGFVASDITGIPTIDYVEDWANNSGEVLYNGITLPEEWPPTTMAQYGNEEMPVPYLTAKPNVININTGRQLFVDDFLIESTTLSREWHKAEKYEGNPVMKPETAQELGRERSDGSTYGAMAAPNSGGVWYDSEDNLFKMWYRAGWWDGTALATSKDGVTWERGEYDVEPGTNLVLPLGVGGQRDSDAVIMDPFAPADERFKLFTWGRPDYGEVYTSADGIHWGEPTKVGETGDRSTIFYNPFRDKWVYSIRSSWSNRSRSYSECDDLIQGAALHNTVKWARADNLDIPIDGNDTTPALYNLDAVAYESIMLGAFTIHLGPENQTCLALGTPKTTELHMGFSRDGFHWARSEDRTAFIGATRQEGSWERGYLHSNASICLVNDDELWFYYTGFEGDTSKTSTVDEIWSNDATNGMYSKASTGLATLRRDGFASMNAVDATGELVTEKVTFDGKYLFVNADVEGGSVKAEILDESGNVIEGYSASDCTAVTGDTTKAMLTFGKDLSSLSGKNVKFRFLVENGKLYSFWVTDDSVNGASNGYLAGGSIGQNGLVDTAASYVTTDEITAITDASVTLGESITVNYYATLEDEYKEATMQFTMNEKVVPVKGEHVEGNEYRFSFEGVSPQCMTDEIKAQLVCEEEILDTYDSFTIRSYCDSLLASDAVTLGMSGDKYVAMKTLVADLLEYGAMSQTYRNYKTDALANKNITGQREFVALTNEWKAAPTNTGENVKITAGGVWFANVNKLYLKFTTKDISNTTLEFDGKIYTSEDFELVSDNTYIFYSDSILPSEFGVEKTAQFKYGDTVETSITYSVNHYVYAKQTQETAMGNLARALYNYGISAVAYTELQ